jgi:hypothetical protein
VLECSELRQVSNSLCLLDDPGSGLNMNKTNFRSFTRPGLRLLFMCLQLPIVACVQVQSLGARDCTPRMRYKCKGYIWGLHCVQDRGPVLWWGVDMA